MQSVGDAMLLREGYTLLWVGWQFDVPRNPELMRLYAPVPTADGRPLEGLVRSDFVVTERTFDHSLGDRGHMAYGVANPADPRNVLTVCLGKSTYARCGIIVNVTPLEPEWEGHVTLEFSNTTPLPARVYANEGVAQVIFLESDEPCETSYRERGGKYQGQKGVTLPRI